MNNTIFAQSVVDADQTVKEQDLVIPMLLVLAQADRQKKGPLSTYQLHLALRDMFVMSDEDNEIVRRDNVTRFQRTIHNTISHDLLTKNKWAVRKDNGWVITPKGRAHLLDNMLEPKEPLPNGEMRVLTDGERVLENAVAFYMLVRLAELQKDNKTPISTAQLRKDIKSSLPLSVSDLSPLKNRPDTKIDQIVRNVVSHNTLTRNGWATRNEKGFVITLNGKAQVLNSLLEVFPSPDFSFLIKEENVFRAAVNARRAEVAADAAARRRAKQRP